MNWLAKISLNTVVKRLGTFRSALLLMLIVGICLFCGYRMGNFYHSFQEQTLEQQKQRLESLYSKNVDQTRRIHTLEVELEVERLANKNAQALVKSIEQKHYQVKRDLAFYEKVMAPEKEADGLIIDRATLYPTASSQHYRFQVVLVQQKLRKRFAKGYAELTLSGSLNGKPAELTLDKISTLTKKDLSFSFQYFQIVEGSFTLPEGFIAERAFISVILPKGKWQTYHRLDEYYSWSELLENNH